MTLRLATLLALLPACALATPDDTPFTSLQAVRPAAIEANWTKMKMPDGGRTAFASINYLMALNDDWGFGPGVYGAAKGDYGGIFTVGFTGQRRWRLTGNTHLAASLYVGAGGGLSNQQLRFGGGLMLRPELSLRTETGAWYSGIGISQIRFPSGNVKSGVGLSFVLGRTMEFASFAPEDAGRPGRSGRRTGLGFDEISLTTGVESPRSSSVDRSGEPRRQRIGKAGADLRQYIAEGSWWGIEAAGAAKGGADGYMEVLGQIGQDWALGSPRLRLGGQLGLGLAGGGAIDTGSGLLLRAGPALRWITPWGPSLRLDAGLSHAPNGHYSARFVRFALSMPLDSAPVPFGSDAGGTVRVQQLGASVLHMPRMRFKDGREEAVTHLAVTMSREFSPRVYGTAQAGSAAAGGNAGAYSFGLFGLGVQSEPLWSGMRVGAELLVGAAGGGGVKVGGGAVTQAELWAQWPVGDRLRLRAGIGEFRTVRGSDQSSTLTQLGLSYAFGTLTR
jgi:hypothetical protein